MAQQENTGCGWKTWAIIIIAIVACFRYCSLPSCGDGSDYNEEGYEYACAHLKSPSTAVLLSYITADDCAELLEEDGWLLKNSVSICGYEIEATNGFGGRVKNWFYVLFYKGKPCYCDERPRDLNGWSYWFSAAAINTGHDMSDFVVRK